ncbi:MAG TPA: YicC/YloC family endoribonuclease [Polyangiaceae bacterium]|nr:YicC/YloC family endoribonuclease [Polyangiaceae bacterium]
MGAARAAPRRPEAPVRSMTGFGLGEQPFGGGRVCAEVRSLNHRFLELRVRLPLEITEHTFFVEQLCRERLGRGRYDISVRLDGNVLPAPQLDLERVRNAYQTLQRLRDELSPGSELPLGLLAGFPDLFSSSGSGDPEPLRLALTQAIGKALARLDEMRDAEGRRLAVELGDRLRSVRNLVSELARHGPGLLEAQQARLQQRLARLLGGVEALDPARLALEVAVLVDRSDTTEELVRLESHFDQFEASLSAPGPSGRKLDFLLQEMGRETNTIGAKCQDANLSHLVVALKAEVERLREQVQNIE